MSRKSMNGSIMLSVNDLHLSPICSDTSKYSNTASHYKVFDDKLPCFNCCIRWIIRPFFCTVIFNFTCNKWVVFVKDRYTKIMNFEFYVLDDKLTRNSMCFVNAYLHRFKIWIKCKTNWCHWSQVEVLIPGKRS